jgi:hypothetical protein
MISWKIYIASNNKCTQAFMQRPQQFCLISNKSEVSQQHSPIQNFMEFSPAGDMLKCVDRHEELVDVFLRYNHQDVTFLNLFISIMLYMFWMEPPPIIRSSDSTYSFWFLLNLAATCCDHGWHGTLLRF